MVVAMEIFGLHEYIKDVTRRLAKLGAFAVAPDYYFRKGDLTKIAEIKELLPVVNAKPDAELLSDLDATVAWAKVAGRRHREARHHRLLPRRAHGVWEYAAHSGTGLKAGVAFYGPPVDAPNPLWPKSPTAARREMKAPVLGLYGGADTGIPVAQVEAAQGRARARTRRPPSSRSIPARRTVSMPTIAASYRKDAAEDAWKQTQAWFKKYGVLG